MRAFVVYESLYGNTHAVAEAIAVGLREHGEVDLVAVADAASLNLADADLLVVGGPTHVHGMSSEHSRKSAHEDATRKADGQPEPDVEVRRCATGLPGSVASRACGRRRSTRESAGRSS